MNELARAFREHREVLDAAETSLATPFTEAADLLAQRVLDGHRILVCGNGGSAADAQHFASELVGRFEADRRAIPAQILHGDPSTLTAIANDVGYEQVFARQVDAFGAEDDILVAISTSGRSPNIVEAARRARARGLTVIALTGRTGGDLAGLSDVVLFVPADVVARIQEVHGIVIHALADAIERAVRRADGDADA